MKKTTLLKKLVNDPEILVMPGAHDALTARVIEKAGFKAVTSGGYSISASVLGKPDIGLLGMKEMADFYRNVVQAVDIPVFADADTGYGDVNNVIRTVQEYEQAGVAGLFIEDQVFPKRCGHMEGKSLIPADDMVAKIRAALYARKDPDFVIMARTDAVAVEGIDEAIRRGRMYADAGIDLMFVEAVRDVEQMKRVVAEIPKPQLANIIDGGKTPMLTYQELEKIGYAVVVYPNTLSYAVAKTAMKFMETLKRDGSMKALRGELLSFDEFFTFMGTEEIREQEKIFYGKQ